jgi:cytochrome c-type biogenesis protein CcmH
VRAGRPLPPVTAADNDAGIQAIEKQLHCTCGCNLDVYTCRTTDFTCTVSPAMHQRVLALAQQGRTGPEIIAQFVREQGVTILMAPPTHGVFNLAAYVVPSLLILVAGAVLTLVLRRWTRAAAPARGEARPDAGPAATPEELARVRRELDRRPT